MIAARHKQRGLANLLHGEAGEVWQGGNEIERSCAARSRCGTLRGLGAEGIAVRGVSERADQAGTIGYGMTWER